MQYLFPLAHLCHVPPPMTGDLRVVEFGVLIKGIDEWLAERQRGVVPDGVW